MIGDPHGIKLGRLAPTLAFLVLLSGCQFTQPQWLPWRAAPARQADDAGGGAHPAAVEELQLLGWANAAADRQALPALIERFNAANPDLHVTFTAPDDYELALQTLHSGGPAPALVLLDAPRARELMADDLLSALDAAATNNVDFFPSLRSALSLDGALYCAPREVRTLALLYNRSLFDAAGAAYPSAAWSWDDLRNAAQQLKDAKVALKALVLPPDFSRWLPFLYQAGGAVTDDAMSVMTINSDAANTAMTFYTDLVINGLAAPPADLDSIWSGEAFGRGDAAMALEGNWAAPYLAEHFPELNYGVAELPRGPQTQATLAFATCYGIPAATTQRAAAQRLLSFLTQPDNLLAVSEPGATMPPFRSGAAVWLETHADQAAFLAGMEYAHPWLFGPRFTPLFNTVDTGLQQAFLSVRSVEDILAEADGVGNRALAR